MTAMRFYFICILLVSMNSFIYSQHMAQGIIKEEGNGKPLQGASVFLSNTKTGMAAGADGRYNLLVPEGDYDMIVSSVGFETKQIRISHLASDTVINVMLRAKPAELTEVIVKSYEKDGWKKWGDLFLKFFMGTSYEAQKCTIENKEAIHFIHSKSTGIVTAFADEPLQIVNKALGYRLQFQLEKFSYNPANSLSIYAGFPLFRDMEGDERQQKQWNKNRMNVYKGSVMQFMRALYKNNLQQEGFEINAIWKPTAQEIIVIKKRIARDEIPKDSLTYYLHVASADPENGIALKTETTENKFVHREDSTMVILQFPGFINVWYIKGRASEDYNSQAAPDEKNEMKSQLSLSNHDMPVSIQKNGSFFPVLNLYTTGYWAWSEKVARLLPLDYQLSGSSK